MKSRRPTPRTALLALAAVLSSAAAQGHSASDAYLTFTRAVQDAHSTGPIVIHAQWDIALRDLDFVLKLDDDGDGDIVWGELRKHQLAIAQYAYQFLKLGADGAPCEIKPTAQMVDGHADGTYASLMFDVVCSGAPKRLTLDYRLFFAVDPSHRAILLMRNGSNISTAVLSSDKVHLDFAL
jgi:hypothetical protein